MLVGRRGGRGKRREARTGLPEAAASTEARRVATMATQVHRRPQACRWRVQQSHGGHRSIRNRLPVPAQEQASPSSPSTAICTRLVREPMRARQHRHRPRPGRMRPRLMPRGSGCTPQTRSLTAPAPVPGKRSPRLCQRCAGCLQAHLVRQVPGKRSTRRRLALLGETRALQHRRGGQGWRAQPCTPPCQQAGLEQVSAAAPCRLPQGNRCQRTWQPRWHHQ